MAPFIANHFEMSLEYEQTDRQTRQTHARTYRYNVTGINDCSRSNHKYETVQKSIEAVREEGGRGRSDILLSLATNLFGQNCVIRGRGVRKWSTIVSIDL